MAATTDQQLPLTVAPRGGSSHLNKPARQLVPAFLQKLYEMVNDPADQDLIRWSDTGDSFFVLDQERFASEVLGRWFKHKNFSSFVRQLNMYGFHKIPHLQQGVLRSDSDTEFWNFEHPHFLRGQPDLLCLIQRKKQTATAGEDGHAAPAAGKDSGGTSAVGTLSANQLVDIHSIVNGIQAIKRHQAAISADLNELKSSNQHLWQEAMTARERHKKHQDTINRILKFLAGVFGPGESGRKDDDASHAVVARKPPRLMIADGRSGKKADIDEVTVTEDEPRSSVESARSTNSMDLFGSLDTPGPPSEAFASPRFTSIEPSVSNAPTPVASNASVQQENRLARGSTSSDTNNTSLITSTNTTPTPLQANNDHIVQTALSSVLNSPSQMQKLLAALAAQSISPDVLPAVSQPHPQHLIAPTPYNNDPHQYTPGINSGSGNALLNAPVSARLPASHDYAPVSPPSPFTLSLLGAGSDTDHLVPLAQEDDRLQKTYKNAAEIDNDVDELQNNIQSLIQSLGIDPGTLEAAMAPTDTLGVSGGGAVGPAPAGNADIFPSVNMGTGPDFDFDSFLMDMPRANEDDGEFDRLAERLDPTTVIGSKASDSTKIGNASTQQLHAFLDEVASQDGSESVGRHAQLPQLHPSPGFNLAMNPASGVPGAFAGVGTGAGARGRKRKSDVIADGGPSQGQPQSLPGPVASSISGNKSKRKR